MKTAAAFCFLLSAFPLWAHHELRAEFDERKPVSLHGIVTQFEWDNPHAFLYLDVTDAQGGIVNWAVEWASPLQLRKAGWTTDSLQVGDSVTVEGWLARDGSKLASGRSVVLANGKRLAKVREEEAAPARARAKPTPRWPDGHPRLGVVPGEMGYWAHPSAPSLIDSTAGKIRMDGNGLLANLADADKVAPFQPWAKGLYEYRQRTLLKDDPMLSCLPPAGPRMFQAAHGVQFLEQPERQRIFVMSGGGNRNWRLIYLDGRALPQSDDVTPTYWGYSSGHWDGDTLVVESDAFNERFWFSNGGLPHTEYLRLTEKFSRPDFDTLRYEVTVNDPGTYARPWTSAWTLRWAAGQDIQEYFCQDDPQDESHMVAPGAKPVHR
ncbi:MAG TPA: DUF6152 family protein [Bryobacteraceae bacterium]|nr:DUF6152 family protein [Bryobacteraceae bacterium]HUO32737.1 DUF6152 family protein [Bryobacteraceae bacterium]